MTCIVVQLISYTVRTCTVDRKRDREVDNMLTSTSTKFIQITHSLSIALIMTKTSCDKKNRPFYENRQSFTGSQEIVYLKTCLIV